MASLISIILCTRNRAADLRLTLESLRLVCVPPWADVELIVVDNGSSDETRLVATSTPLGAITPFYVLAARAGQVFARSAGIEAARGEAIIFTDDDVRMPADWIVKMGGPLLEGKADALAGGVRLAPHLNRTWMLPMHRSLLASTETIDPAAPERMVGANMSVHRRILDKVPAFDSELGPGALGFMDDSLFSYQIKQAGFRLGGDLRTEVEHHLHPDRLLRTSWLERAKKQGASAAYVDHHWRHQAVRWPLLKHIWMHLKVYGERFSRYAEVRQAEGAPLSELQLVHGVWYYRQMAKESSRSPNYEYLGLSKLGCRPPHQPRLPGVSRKFRLAAFFQR